MLTNDQAVCIRAVDYSETSQIVTFFARNTGKLSLIAKGAKRNKNPFGGPIDIFSYGNIVFSDAGRDKLAPLTEFEPLEGDANSSVLAQDLYILHCCLFAVELIDLLTKEYDAHPGLFDCLITFLRDVSRKKVKVSDGCRGEVLALLILFQLRLLKEIGLSPVFDFCVNCNRAFNVHWNSAYFSVNAKGLICRDCQGAFPDKIQIKLQTVKGLADIKSLDSAEYNIKKEAEDLLINYIADILGRHPRMAKYILK
ncbi:MAG: DNA repair protein RecO [Sedimentisphaerales bacterium]|nr:DNA repair protein RecO [Sedimentisphaerales bacterium]